MKRFHQNNCEVTAEVTAEVLQCSAPDGVLIKTITDNGPWAGRMVITQLKFSEPIHFWASLVLQATLPGTKRPPCVASVFPKVCFHYSSRSNPVELDS